MKLTICGHDVAAKILEKSPKKLDIIFISSPENKYAVDGSEKIVELARESCELLFNDITFPIGHSRVVPEEHHVKKALEFAKGKKELIVSCQMGVSRSAAIAYLIEASIVGYEKAFDILDMKIHSPNLLVIKHGAKLLGEQQILAAMLDWKNKSNELDYPDVWEL